jgi:hypothetical protein
MNREGTAIGRCASRANKLREELSPCDPMFAKLRPVRIFPFLLLPILLGACDPAHFAYFAISPHPNEGSDSGLAAVFSLVERIARRHGLSAQRPIDPVEGWRACFGAHSVTICGKTLDNEAQFTLSEWSGFGGFHAATDSLRREMLDSLRAAFGTAAVRECRWRRSSTDARKDGCPVLGAPDST